jgi:hypothetical protein
VGRGGGGGVSRSPALHGGGAAVSPPVDRSRERGLAPIRKAARSKGASTWEVAVTYTCGGRPGRGLQGDGLVGG